MSNSRNVDSRVRASPRNLASVSIDMPKFRKFEDHVWKIKFRNESSQQHEAMTFKGDTDHSPASSYPQQFLHSKTEEFSPRILTVSTPKNLEE